MMESFLPRFQPLWREIGYSETEQQEEQKAIEEKLENLLQEYASALNHQKDRISNTLDRCKNAVAQLSNQLDVPCEDATPSSGSLREQQTLWTEKETRFIKLREEALERLSAKHRELHDLWNQLGLEPEARLSEFVEVVAATDRDLSSRREEDYARQIQLAQDEKTKRLAFLDTLCADIKKLWTDLALEMPAPRDDASTQGGKGKGEDALYAKLWHAPESLGVAKQIIEELGAKKTQLSAELVARQERLTQYAARIDSLWKDCDTPQEHRDAFLARHQGIGRAVLEACEQEIDRLVALRRERLEGLVLDRRAKITELWNTMGTGEEERTAFAPFHSESFTEELLAEHDAHLEALAQRREEMQPILAAIERREAILQQKADFERASSDPTRLTKRDPGRLLREEKFRKVLAKELPRIERELRTKCQAWEQCHGPFLYNGTKYLDNLGAALEGAKPRVPALNLSATAPVCKTPGGAGGRTARSRLGATAAPSPTPRKRSAPCTPRTTSRTALTRTRRARVDSPAAFKP